MHIFLNPLHEYLIKEKFYEEEESNVQKVKE